jgi:hypothetical protein
MQSSTQLQLDQTWEILCYYHNHMRNSLFTTLLLFIVAIVSILAQGILFLPALFEFVLQYLPSWGNITFGATVYNGWGPFPA